MSGLDGLVWHNPENEPRQEGLDDAACSPSLEVLEPPAEGTSPAVPTEVGGCALHLLAMAGYMKDRHLLCEKLSVISSLYERDIALRNSIISEIERIDKISFCYFPQCG